MTLYLTLFFAGLLTIFLPCILPLLPVVLGVSIAGKSRWRPLATILGMVTSFVLLTFTLLVLLDQFVELADYIRIATFDLLLLFGAGFLSSSLWVRRAAAVIGAFFFLDKGIEPVVIAMALGFVAVEIGSSFASKLQTFGVATQNKARAELGADNPLTAFIIGLSLGLVWAPCAGPALGFALALVREQPGSMAFFALLSYALGTAVPLLIVGYGGQAAVHSVRSLARFAGVVKIVAGIALIATAFALQLNLFPRLQIWIVDNTGFGKTVSKLEEALFLPPLSSSSSAVSSSDSSSAASVIKAFSSSSMFLPKLPTLVRAPEFTGLGSWHNSEPFTLASLKGKVVLVDFWTYSCINCIRTFPYIQGYWEKYKDTGKFVILGVHSPEFTFEKSEKNVAMAIKEHGLTYPVAQDNDFGTWSAFANRYWPAKYLIDANGMIRYEHFGEGSYDETDLAIASLLKEAGVDVSDAGIVASSESRGGYRDVSRETYLGERSWPALGNAKGEPSSDPVVYEGYPMQLVLHKYYLSGTWQLEDGEMQVLQSDEGTIAMRFRGGEINLVLGLAEGAKPVEAEVTLDGKLVKTFTIDHHDLYELFKGEYGDHDIVLSLKGKGAEAFAFTFGQ